MGGTINVSVGLALGGFSQSGMFNQVFSLALLAVCVLGTIYLIYRSDLRSGMLKKRIRAFEIGCKTGREEE